MRLILLIYNFIFCALNLAPERNRDTNIDRSFYCEIVKDSKSNDHWWCMMRKHQVLYLQKYNNSSELPFDIIVKQRVVSLIIRDWDIEAFPRDVFRFKHLIKLSIRWSAIKEMPAEIGTLITLKTLDLSFNDFKKLPLEIGSLQQLQILDLSFNRFKKLPDDFPIIQSLQILSLSGNDITEFPEGALCPLLQKIDLSCNLLKYIKSSVLDKLEKYGSNFILDLTSSRKIELESHGDKCGLVEIARRLGSRVLYDVPPMHFIKQAQFDDWYDDKKIRDRNFETKAFLFKYQNALQWESDGGKHTVMQINRDDVLKGTIQYFTKNKPQRYMSHAIKIKYEGEIGADYGGLFKDWLDNVSKSFMSEEKKLFEMASTDERTGMRPVKKKEQVSDKDMLPYVVLGKIISLAILRNCPLRLCLHWSIYMYLTDTRPTMEAVKHFDDELYKQLQRSLQPTDQDSELNVVFVNKCKRRRVETNAVDKHVPETNENNKDNVDLYLHELYEGYVNDIIPQLKSIKKGMNEMLKYKILHVFHPHELELLVCGQANVDIDEWKKNTIYKNVNSNDNVIKWLWEIIGSWDDKKVTAIYKFITGSSRVSFSGVERLTIVKELGVDKDRYPCASTCFNKLYLSDYSSKEKFAELLEETLLNSDVGFYKA